MPKNRISIIGTVGVPGKYGGFETLAHNLVLSLNEYFAIKVYCSGKFYKKGERQKYWNGARLHYIPFKANGFQSIIYDIISIIHACFVSDTILVLGVSGGIVLPFVRLFTRKKIIVNIDGIEWRREKWGWMAKRFLRFSEYLCIRFSHVDITDNEAIKEYTAQSYGTLSRFIAYGSDHTQKINIPDSAYETYPFLRGDYAFKVCRIEPENNIEMVLEAFETSSELPLVMVGNWNNSPFAQALKAKYKGHPNIYILDPIYDQEQLDVLRSNATIYVHGHSAGGTNPSLVEAMNLGLPVIAFDVSFNRYTTGEMALFFKTVDQLKLRLEEIEDGEYDLEAIGENLQERAMKEYTWSWIAMKYRNLFYSIKTIKGKSSAVSNYNYLTEAEMRELDIPHLKSSLK